MQPRPLTLRAGISDRTGPVTFRNIIFAAGLFCGFILAVQSGNAQNPAQPTQTTPSSVLPPAGDPIGNVATLSGSATIARFGNATALKVNDDVYLGDTLQTGADSELGVTFNDDTTFNLSSNARIVINNYVYEEGGKKNAALFNVARGTVAFVANAVAKTGDMKISTPTATLGIRGTTGVIDVPDNVSASGGGNEVAIKLYPDQDGRVGHIEVNGRDGARLGLLSRASSGFAIRPGAGGRFTAAALQISPQQAARDQGFVRQVHAAQGIGRQIVTQQRALRQQNLSRQPGKPQTPGQQKQQGTPKAPGAQKQQLQKQQLQKPQPGLQKQQPVAKPAGAPKIPGQTPDRVQAPATQNPSTVQKPVAPAAGPTLQRTPRQPPLLRRAPSPRQQKQLKERR
ncbi:MAG: FecR domain-containing protein [Xanthobacteraceae bacterium]|nr:FecR domain-containing protein [Xanthobacteraceae bacterium]